MPLDDTPCPFCGKRTDMVAGINVIPAWRHLAFLVCWKCNRIRVAHGGRDWLTLQEARRKANATGKHIEGDRAAGRAAKRGRRDSVAHELMARGRGL